MLYAYVIACLCDYVGMECSFIAIPGLPLLYSDPDMCPWMLVVDYYLGCILFTLYLSYRMCWEGLLQVG